MITVLGATGYTGRLVAKSLAKQGIPFRLAGRSAEKLSTLAESLPGSPSWLVADAIEPATLHALFEDTTVLVNCAGPFTDLGGPVVAQAALNGVHYLDISNELGYVYQLRSYDALARRSGSAIVPACGFEVALADCAAAVLAANMASSHPLDEIRVIYGIPGRGSSIGSRRSAVRALATSWLGYAGGQWVLAIPGHSVQRTWLLDGHCPVLSFPSSEIATVPSHLPVQQVTTWLAISRSAFYWAPLLIPFFARLAKGLVGKLVEIIISQVFSPPETGLRSHTPFAIKVEAQNGDERQALTITGQGVYELTAEIVAYVAGRLAQPGYDRSGVLAPASAVSPEGLLEWAVSHWQVKIEQGTGDE